MRKVEARRGRELAEEWDNLAADRDAMIGKRLDLSYHHILLPALYELSAQALATDAHILDVGCGTGTMATELAEKHPGCDITAIDPSPRSIEIAKQERGEFANVMFRCASVEDYAKGPVAESSSDLIIANMLLQNVASLSDVLDACVRVMKPGAALVFAVAHPCFWPRYWKYEKEPWFRYDTETWIEAPFRTSLSPGGTLTTTHTHRPLSAYLNAFAATGLSLEEMVEPYPDQGIEGEYPIAWEFPRFLLGRYRKGGTCGS
ncbi:class I SAM-dependent methyltransferase [Streptomyces sp. NPDC046853]|uniref:class I SAM-dependent methyltransferase n=1 Tax=unclassified Streptomyces TaxID=2593676 RepID=UPI0034025CD0